MQPAAEDKEASRKWSLSMLDVISDPSNILDGARSDDVVHDDYTAPALSAIAELSLSGQHQIASMQRLGAAVLRAKDALDHGQFRKWCSETLHKSPSWCSSHRRLYEKRADLEPALNWAAETGHPWANCHSVELLLKLIAAWNGRHSEAAPKARRKAKDVIEELRQQLEQSRKELEENEKDFVALRDDLPSETMARVAQLTAKSPVVDGDIATQELAAIAQRYHWRLCDLLAQTCSGPHVSSRPSDASAEPDDLQIIRQVL
jgi:hypothetical protein